MKRDTMNHEYGLVRYDAMVNAIAECHRVDEAREIHEKARAMEIYARQAMNTDAERKATEIRLRAERRAGELLRELERVEHRLNGRDAEGKPVHASNDATPEKSEYAVALERTGLSRQTANRWQQLATVPAAQFESHLADQQAIPTTSSILRAANGSKRMDDCALWLWGQLRDFERDGRLNRDPVELYEAMTETMQADVRRIIDPVLAWLGELQEAIR